MFLSVFDIFKIGIGPSSSHTFGPMVAAARFLDRLRQQRRPVAGLRASLHGSLAFTGRGHGTDRAVALGFAGFKPETFDAADAEATLTELRSSKAVMPPGLPRLRFDPDEDLVFDFERRLPGHSNGMVFKALDAQGGLIDHETYYSVGGGFVLTAAGLAAAPATKAGPDVPFPFRNASELLAAAARSGLSIAEMTRANERAVRTDVCIDEGIGNIWSAMEACINRGLETGGTLPGGLGTKRRAQGIHARLVAGKGSNSAPPHSVNDWISVYAMAVNEENAAGGQIVTAPTNGAAGVVPAVLKYFLGHVPGASRERVAEYLLTAAAIAGIIKRNASISGAECGCQAEVGSAAAMAAAGLCAVLGGSPEQVENAAEIALEHHLGMTCDPVAGLVQVPCIERNGLGAVKAVTAASLSLHGDGSHRVPLDACIETMRQTGEDMRDKYKETSLGGLAMNVPYC